MNARLLAISWEMPPLSGPRAIQVSRLLAALTRHGWTSRVIAVEPQPGGPLLRDTSGVQRFAVDGVDVSRVPSPQEGLLYRAAMRLVPGLARRPDRQRGWLPAAVREAERWMRAERHQCLVSFAQPWTDHLVALRLAREHDRPWIAHFSDPWADSPYQSSAPGALAYATRAEADVVRHASALVFVTQETADAVMAKYPASWKQKVHVIPHGHDARAHGGIRRQRPRERRMQIVYTGRFYPGLRTPETLFAALARVAKSRPLHDELEVVLIGPGLTDYQAQVRAHGLQDLVRLRDAVPYEQALQAAADADALLVLDADARGASMFLPSKVIDYLPWRVPILGLTPHAGATAALLRRLGMPVAAPNDVDAVAAALMHLLDGWRAGATQVSEDFPAVAAEYDIERTSRAFAHVLSIACGAAAAGSSPAAGDQSMVP